MKIAVYHNQPSGGARRALFGFCRELSRRHRLDVFTLTTSDQDLISDRVVSSSVTALEYRPRPPVRGGLWLNDLRLWSNLADLDRVNQTAAELIDSRDCDVVLVDACRYTYAPYVLRHLRTPAVYYCHHGPWRVPHELRAQSGAYDRLRRAWHFPFTARLERRLVEVDAAMTKRASRVITNSDYSRIRIAREYGIDAAVCPPGVDIPKAEQRTRAAHLVSIGALEVHKGHDLVIRAVAELPAGIRPELRIIANDGNSVVRRELETLAARLSVRLTIRWRIPDSKMRDELATALIFVYGAHAEPLGLGLLEAMAHGLPVVATREGGVAETVEPSVTGFLCSRDPAEMSGRIWDLLASRDRREAMGRAGRQAVEAQWTWPARVAALETQLRETQIPHAPAVELTSR